MSEHSSRKNSMSEGRPTNPRLTCLRNFSSLVLGEGKGEEGREHSWGRAGE